MSASKVGAELLFDVISTAYKRSSVIVTTNLPCEEWKEGFFAYPPERVYSRHYPVVTDGAEGVSPR